MNSKSVYPNNNNNMSLIYIEFSIVKPSGDGLLARGHTSVTERIHVSTLILLCK